LDLFLVRLLLSFLIAGTWVTIITESTVKYGPRAGGLLAGFPSTVPFSLAFIGWTQSAATAVEATTALPLALAFTAAFPLVYALLAKGGRFWFALAGSLAFWGTASSVLSAVSITFGADYWVSLVGFYAISAVFYITLARKHRPRMTASAVRLTPFEWIWRFVLAGGIVVCAVLLSSTLGPLVGGVFASFPAIITSTIYIVKRVEGVEASRSIAVPVMVSSLFTIVPYTVVVRYSFPVLGVLFGTLVAYIVAIPLSFAAYYLTGRLVGRRESDGFNPQDASHSGTLAPQAPQNTAPSRSLDPHLMQ
jgi:hypothetical protein